MPGGAQPNPTPPGRCRRRSTSSAPPDHLIRASAVLGCCRVFLGATADRAYSLIANNKDINSFYNRLLGQPPNRTDPYGFGVSTALSFSLLLLFRTAVAHRRTEVDRLNPEQVHTAGHYIHAVDPGG